MTEAPEICSSTEKKLHGFWSTQTLRERLPSVVEPYDSERTRHAVHRLSMGWEYYVTQDASAGFQFARTTKKLKHHGESFSIPSGHFAFLLTEETINMPNDALGFVSIQTDVKFLGLVNISGFHVDPGSSGKIIFSVFNAGPQPVHIRQGEAIFRLWITNLDFPDEYPRTEPSHAHIPSRLVNGISGSLESIQSLSHRIDSLGTKVNNFLILGGLLWVLTLALAPVLLASDWGKNLLKILFGFVEGG